MARHSGKNQKVVINSVTYRSSTWSAEKLNPRIDVTSGEDSGKGTYLQGVIDYEFSAELFWNDETPFTSLAEGSSVTATLTSDTGATLTGSVFIERISVTPEVRGPVRLRISGVFSGGGTPSGL